MYCQCWALVFYYHEVYLKTIFYPVVVTTNTASNSLRKLTFSSRFFFNDGTAIKMLNLFNQTCSIISPVFIALYLLLSCTKLRTQKGRWYWKSWKERDPELGVQSHQTGQIFDQLDKSISAAVQEAGDRDRIRHTENARSSILSE